ncbi:hypothetical protein [Microbacterium sp. SSM24]|uniref:hypothetical protein n=1 Tax=Microbacterium sp. SSM24 TaxID=2991714 RepID=UPI002226CB30|nr:hypothetical protein [Microbacterium sp. SSM24]MCW3494207.1 hypothetical protein [Microbacterium sp. SSM24]
MTVQVVNASGSYRVALDRELWRTSALVIAPLVDEWTQAAPSGVSARAITPRTFAHVTGSHLVVTGLAEQALRGLDAGPVDIDVELHRRGHGPQHVTITVPMASSLPFESVALAVGSTTIRLAGRVTAAAFPHAAVPGASVALTGIATPLLTVTAPLAADHAAGTTVRVRALAAGAATSLTAPARAGDMALRVLSAAGIGSGTLLAVGQDIVVADGTAGRVVLLRTPVAVSAADGDAVTIHAPGASGAGTALARPVLAGDGLLPSTAALAGAAIEIVDGPSTEFRRTSLTTDADGRWRLAGVRGIPEISATTTAGGFLADGPRQIPLAPTDPFIVNTSLRT